MCSTEIILKCSLLFVNLYKYVFIFYMQSFVDFQTKSLL